jgi:predicted nucleotidyltransferase component of viral defense system
MTRDIPASVRGQLENLAKSSGRPLQELMQYFVMERFLFRLSQSEYADRFVLKGALMFTVWGTPQSRATRDIDLLARAENSVDAMSNMIKDVCRQPVESDGVEFLRDSVHGAIIKENAEYSGVRVTFVAMIQNARLPMQIDIGFGDVIYPTATMIDYPTMLHFETPRLKGYPKETVIAEKFEAMVKLGQLNSRMKDFYDIHVLLRQFEFDGEILRHAIERTFANRGTMIDSEPFVFSPPFLEDSVKQTQWTAFVRKSKLTGAPDSFADVVREIQAFLLPLVQAVSLRQNFSSRWTSGRTWSSQNS